MQPEPYQTSRYIAWFAGGKRSDPVVRFYFQRTTIHSLATQRLAEFSKAFFQNVLQRWTAMSKEWIDCEPSSHDWTKGLQPHC